MNETSVKQFKTGNERTRAIRAAVLNYLGDHPHLLAFDPNLPSKHQYWRSVALVLRDKAKIYSPAGNIGDIASVTRRLVLLSEAARCG